MNSVSTTPNERFQSTPPARRATCELCAMTWEMWVSIHAPRAEGDAARRAAMMRRSCFNPRPPRGGRPAPETAAVVGAWSFNPRPPRGGRPSSRTGSATACPFQSTPPARRATFLRVDVHGGASRFQSTPPARRATDRGSRRRRRRPVSIHAPRAEGDDPGSLAEQVAIMVSIHAPRAEGDQPDAPQRCDRGGFNPRPPRGGRPA